MARPRIPKAKAEVEGRIEHDKKRFINRIEPASGPLGDAPDWMVDLFQRKAWEQFRRELPWLREADRTHTAIAATILGRMMAPIGPDGEGVGVQALNLLRQCLGQMGATPADASKVSIPDAGEDPDDALFNRE